MLIMPTLQKGDNLSKGSKSPLTGLHDILPQSQLTNKQKQNETSKQNTYKTNKCSRKKGEEERKEEEEEWGRGGERKRRKGMKKRRKEEEERDKEEEWEEWEEEEEEQWN